MLDCERLALTFIFIIFKSAVFSLQYSMTASSCRVIMPCQVGRQKIEPDDFRKEGKAITSFQDHPQGMHIVCSAVVQCNGGELVGRIHQKQRHKEKHATPNVPIVCKALSNLHLCDFCVHWYLNLESIHLVKVDEHLIIEMGDLLTRKVLAYLRSFLKICGSAEHSGTRSIKNDFAAGCHKWSVGTQKFAFW